MHPQNSTLCTHKQLNKTLSLCVVKLCTPNVFALASPLVTGASPRGRTQSQGRYPRGREWSGLPCEHFITSEGADNHTDGNSIIHCFTELKDIKERHAR
jgi:hypothetical protein